MNSVGYKPEGEIKRRIKEAYVTNKEDFFCEFTDKTFALTNEIMYKACREGRDGYLHEVTITRKGCEQKKGYLLNLNR